MRLLSMSESVSALRGTGNRQRDEGRRQREAHCGAKETWSPDNSISPLPARHLNQIVPWYSPAPNPQFFAQSEYGLLYEALRLRDGGT